MAMENSSDDAEDEVSEDLSASDHTTVTIMNAKGLKVSGISVANRRYDCNGVYVRAGTAPGYQSREGEDEVPFFRNVASEYYL